jgi:hypothetical protein
MITYFFISAYENFKVARGKLKFIHCDNGTNLKGVQSELAEAVESIILKCIQPSGSQ